MTTRVLLVRHGETTLSAEDRFAGATDVELSEEGRRQARRLGARLGREPKGAISAVYASPMGRTMETGKLVGAACSLEPSPDPAFREIDHGRWEQLTRREVEAMYPEEYAAWEEDPFTFAPEGGESGLSVMARALPALRTIVTRHRNQAVIVVSHKATIRLILASILGIDARGYRDRLDLAPASLTVLDFRDAVRARLMLYNDTSHYADRPRRPQQLLSSWWDDTKANG